MTQRYVTVGGHPAARVVLRVPGIGPWWAEVEWEDAPTISGEVRLALGELELVGTIDPRHDGSRGEQRMARVVAGAGGWSTSLAPKAYHNDLGIRARTIVEDAAREAGETVGALAPEVERIGVDYVRQSGPAGRAVEDVIGHRAWWVDYDGVTHVGTREVSTPADGSYAVLDVDPAERVVSLDVDDLRAVVIGSRLTEGLDAPLVVRELELVIASDRIQTRVWCGADEAEIGASRLAGQLRSLISRATAGRLFGLWRYRVVRMSGVRVELQAISSAAGLPDILPIPTMPGIPGARADLTPGSTVLVEFIEGLRSMPVITHYEGPPGDGFIPVRLTLASASGAPNAARKGDAVQVTIPPGSFLVAATGGGTLNPDPVTVDGEITEGSSLVGIGGDPE